MSFSCNTRQGRQENIICKFCKALEHVLLLVNVALSPISPRLKGLLHLVVWAPHFQCTTIISIQNNRPQMPVLPIVRYPYFLPNCGSNCCYSVFSCCELHNCKVYQNKNRKNIEKPSCQRPRWV